MAAVGDPTAAVGDGDPRAVFPPPRGRTGEAGRPGGRAAPPHGGQALTSTTTRPRIRPSMISAPRRGRSERVAGTAIASILFGSINQVTTIVSTAEFGEVALLIGALLMLRLLPKGISSLVSNRAV